MRYSFDFDRTLFATEDLYEAAREIRMQPNWATPQVWDTLDASSFLYPDTITFLEALERQKIVLLTAWDPVLGPQAYEFQKAKVEKSGISKYVDQIVLMEGNKGMHIQELYDGTPTVFVDDKVEHLLAAKECCPDVRVIQMVRPSNAGLPTDASVQVVTDLAELSDVMYE